MPRSPCIKTNRSTEPETECGRDCTTGPATTLTSTWCWLGTCKYLSGGVFSEPRRVTTHQHRLLVEATDGRARLPNHPQATREHFKNHPTHDRDIDPTIGGHLGRGIGHPWGALGLLCRKEDIAGSKNKRQKRYRLKRTQQLRPGTLESTQRTTRHLVSRRDNTVLLGCSGYRKNTSRRTPARHGRPC